jgi:paraquat-inducible protein A
MFHEACPDCDLLLKSCRIKPGEKAYCPRCGCLLRRPRRRSIERTLALSAAGLILALPATFLPILNISIFGNSHDGNLISGIHALIKQDMLPIAGLVFFASVFIPLLNLTLAFLISLHLYLRKANKMLAAWLRWFQHLNEWAMLEVYALSIIVAYVKLSSMSDLRFGLGLYAFICLLIVNAMLASELDYHFFWQHIGRLGKKP